MLGICETNTVCHAWDVSREVLSSIQPETAFDGAVRTYDIVPMETEVDLLALFVTKREDIEELIVQNTMYEPQKAQLSDSNSQKFSMLPTSTDTYSNMPSFFSKATLM